MLQEPSCWECCYWHGEIKPTHYLKLKYELDDELEHCYRVVHRLLWYRWGNGSHCASYVCLCFGLLSLVVNQTIPFLTWSIITHNMHDVASLLHLYCNQFLYKKHCSSELQSLNSLKVVYSTALSCLMQFTYILTS